MKPRLKTASEPFRRRILRWYRMNARPLPWRRTRNPYHIWVSEVMLQQTTVEAVLPYYKKWIRDYPNIRSLAGTPLPRVLKSWQGLGYYQRAKNMHEAARLILELHGGRFPSDKKALVNLPGIGSYTAAALLSFAFSKSVSLIEANIRRVLMRLLLIQGKADGSGDRILLDFLETVRPKRNSRELNQALMELGALVCRPQTPRCLLCPVSSSCLAYERGEQEVIPRPQKKALCHVEAVVGIIRRRGRYLIQKRPPRGLLADLWEFPGGKRKRGETLSQALRREVKEETGAEVLEEAFLLKLRHAYTRYQVTLSAFECRIKGRLAPKGKEVRWVSLRELRRFPFPSGSARIVEFLETRKDGAARG